MYKRISIFVLLFIICVFSLQAQEPQVREQYNQGIEEAKKGNLDAAIQFYSNAIKMDSDFYPAYSSRGLAYMRKRVTNQTIQKQNFDLAIYDLSKAIELSPKWVGGYINRSSAYSISKEFDKSLADLQKAEEIDAKYPYIFAARGSVYLKMKEYQSAIDSFTKAIEIKRLSTFYTNRCSANYEFEKYEAAIFDCSEATTLNPKDHIAYYFRALVRIKLEQNALAINDLRRVLEINPQYSLAKEKLDLLLKDNKY